MTSGAAHLDCVASVENFHIEPYVDIDVQIQLEGVQYTLDFTFVFIRIWPAIDLTPSILHASCVIFIAN